MVEKKWFTKILSLYCGITRSFQKVVVVGEDGHSHKSASCTLITRLPPMLCLMGEGRLVFVMRRTSKLSI